MIEHFAEFPDSTPIWIYAFDQALSQSERDVVIGQLDTFLATWNSHGEPVHGAYYILENRILIIAGYSTEDISGCSIDSKVQVFKNLYEQYGLNSLGYDRVFYRDAANEITTVSRREFKDLVTSGEIETDTAMFDLTISSVGELRKNCLIVPYSESWHVGVFGIANKMGAIAQPSEQAGE